MNLQDFNKKISEGFQDFFSLGSKSIFGIDIGLSAVKVAEVEAKGNKFKILKYASVALPEGAIIEDEIQKEEEISNAIKDALKKAGIVTRYATLGLAGPNTIAKKLQLAGGTMEEIEDQVVWEAEQYLPFDIEKSTVAFHLLGKNEGGGVDVIVAAAKNDILESFKGVVERADIRIKVIDLSVIAVSNVFESFLAKKSFSPDDSWLILDMGAQKTQFTIYKNKVMAFSKEINIGGLMITEEIQRQLGVNYYEAEDLKIVGDQNGNLPEEILDIVDEIVDVFYGEIKKAFDFYVSSSSDESLSGCYVTGGSSLIPGILEGLEALLNTSVGILDPLQVFEIDERKFDPAIIKEISTRGCAVLGLSMRRDKK